MKMRFISKQKRRWEIAGLVLGAAGILGYISWVVAVNVICLSQETVDRFTPSIRFYDCHGDLVHVRRGYDYRWNFPIDYSEIPKEFITYVIAVEDRNFYTHHGADFYSLFRATSQLLRNGKILSGASTITMQTMTMCTGRERTLRYKLRQIFLACNWEKTHSKKEIMTLYCNILPFGGKIYGIEAAAQYYFGRSAKDLNRAEMILLSGLPQGPTIMRPDRYPQRALMRRDVVLHLLVRNGVISNSEAEAISREPLRYRDFSVKLWPVLDDIHYVIQAMKAQPGKKEYHLALDSVMQSVVKAALQRAQQNLYQVKDGAAVVIENKTGRVRAFVGTLDYKDSVSGAVNAAIAWRSPGSALKPFIYGEAIYGGQITAETRLRDDPLLLADYRPGNFDGAFRGGVTAEEALADSLNTPAVRLLRTVGLNRMLQRLDDLGVIRPEAAGQAMKIGLSLAIGGTETNLLALTAAYSRLAGAPGIPFWSQEDELALEGAENTQLWSQGTRELLLKMMRSKSLPGGGGIEAAWKTGTSNGNRDAWCFAVTPEWTVGVWMGNKNGAASPALVGATAAAPVAGAIMQWLHRESPPLWKETGKLMKVPVCQKTGLALGTGCHDVDLGTAVAGIPLQVCNACRVTMNKQAKIATRVMAPQPGSYLAGATDDAGNHCLVIQLNCLPASSHLYVDGVYKGIHQSGNKVSLPVGRHRLSVWGGDGYDSSSVMITVLEE